MNMLHTNKNRNKSTRHTVGIIGFGRFGKLWADCLNPIADVIIYDINLSAKNSPGFVSLVEVTQADMLFLLVPISEIEKVCKKIAPMLKPDTIVIDACSVKVHPVKIMKKWLPKGQTIIASHPLFGPDSVKRLGLKDQKIVICPVNSTKKQLLIFEKMIRRLQLKIIYATPQEHDRQMAKSQALVHFLGRGLASLKLQPLVISTPDYQDLLRMNDMAQNDTPQLFYDIQKYNPYTKKIRQTFLKSLQKLNREVVTCEAKVCRK